MNIRLLAMSVCLVSLTAVPAKANESADQLERARLLRDLLESRPASRSDDAGANIPGAQILAVPVPAAPDGLRQQQFEDSQWRKLLGSQQTQANSPATQSIPQTQWRSQGFERDRAADALSADILRRSQDWTGGHR
jgi:hypothetical protein